MRGFRRTVAVTAAVFGVGCGGTSREATDDRVPGSVHDSAVAVLPPETNEALVMPRIPDARAGRLVTASAGRDTLAGTWPIRGGRCAAPPSIQLMSETGDVGTMLLIALPDSGPPIGDYLIHRSDSALGPGAARLAVQLFGASRPAAYDASSGTVTVERVDERVSGRFTATLRNVTTRDSVLYAGVFHAVPVESLPAGLCGAVDSSQIYDL